MFTFNALFNINLIKIFYVVFVIRDNELLHFPMWRFRISINLHD